MNGKSMINIVICLFAWARIIISKGEYPIVHSIEGTFTYVRSHKPYKWQSQSATVNTIVKVTSMVMVFYAG